jgi:hypothetical protein
MTPSETFSACGFYLTPRSFSSRILNTDSSDAKLFINCTPDYYLTLDGRLLQIPRGAQSDGISAGQIANALGRGAGGDDWIAGWIHDGGFRGWLLVWNGTEWVKARLSEAEADSYLHECALACGDTEAMADTLYWAVKTFGHRFYNPIY